MPSRVCMGRSPGLLLSPRGGGEATSPEWPEPGNVARGNPGGARAYLLAVDRHALEGALSRSPAGLLSFVSLARSWASSGACLPGIRQDTTRLGPTWYAAQPISRIWSVTAF